MERWSNALSWCDQCPATTANRVCSARFQCFSSALRLGLNMLPRGLLSPVVMGVCRLLACVRPVGLACAPADAHILARPLRIPGCRCARSCGAPRPRREPGGDPSAPDPHEAHRAHPSAVGTAHIRAAWAYASTDRVRFRIPLHGHRKPESNPRAQRAYFTVDPFLNP